jgi:RND superfamily putative drug exporter
MPTTAPQAGETADVVHRLRDVVVPAATDGTGLEVLVGGNTAAFVDLDRQMSARLPILIGAVVALAFVLLMIAFRSILVPLKAALMNLLSVGAAYGVIVAVFQWGWGKNLVGLSETVPIVPWCRCSCSPSSSASRWTTRSSSCRGYARNTSARVTPEAALPTVSPPPRG